MNANEMKICAKKNPYNSPCDPWLLFSSLFQQFIIPLFFFGAIPFFLVWHTTEILDGCLFVVHPDGVKEAAKKNFLFCETM